MKNEDWRGLKSGAIFISSFFFLKFEASIWVCDDVDVTTIYTYIVSLIDWCMLANAQLSFLELHNLFGNWRDHNNTLRLKKKQKENERKKRGKKSWYPRTRKNLQKIWKLEKKFDALPDCEKFVQDHEEVGSAKGKIFNTNGGKLQEPSN